MLSWLAIELSLSNQAVLSHKIGCLANPLKNTAFASALAIAVLCLRTRRPAAALLPLAWLCALGTHSVLPALTNTFFTIHPPLLYVCAVLSIRSVALGLRRRAFAHLSLWAVSICMGGLWSMQELSWGGWWNWDVIECGVAYQWALGAYLLHKSHSCLALSWSSAAGLCVVASVYTSLNKLGVGVSIHSFVTSAVAQCHYGALLLAAAAGCLVLAQRSAPAPLAYVTLLLALYCGARSFAIAKPALLFALFWAPAVGSRRPAVLAPHEISWASAALVLAFNYSNASLGYTHSPRPLVTLLSSSGPFWSLDFCTALRQKMVWDGLWLSKPRYSYSVVLESWATRSPSLRSAFYAFLK